MISSAPHSGTQLSAMLAGMALGQPPAHNSIPTMPPLISTLVAASVGTNLDAAAVSSQRLGINSRT